MSGDDCLVASDANFALAKKQFQEVKVGLEVKKTLGWDLSVSSLQLALQYIHTPEAEQFLDKYLINNVDIMSNQTLVFRL